MAHLRGFAEIGASSKLVGTSEAAVVMLEAGDVLEEDIGVEEWP